MFSEATALNEVLWHDFPNGIYEPAPSSGFLKDDQRSNSNLGSAGNKSQCYSMPVDQNKAQPGQSLL